VALASLTAHQGAGLSSRAKGTQWGRPVNAYALNGESERR